MVKLDQLKENSIKKTKKETKHKYGEYKNILLTDAEKERLVNELGESLFNEVIVFYSAYKEEKNPKTKSDNLTIRRWVIGAVKERRNTSGSNDVDTTPKWDCEVI